MGESKMKIPSKGTLRDGLVKARYPFYADLVSVFPDTIEKHVDASALSDTVIDGLLRHPDLPLALKKGPNFASFVLWNGSVERDREMALVREELARGRSKAEVERETLRRFLAAAVAFEAQANKMDLAELAANLDQVELTKGLERKQTSRKAEALAFFSASKANADFERWLRKDIWSVDEATALILGKDPSVVNRDTLRDFLTDPDSVFAAEFLDVADSLDRGLRANSLSAPLRPRDVVVWATERGLEVPARLKANLPQSLGDSSDDELNKWKQKVETLEAELRSTKEAHNQLIRQTKEIKNPKLKMSALRLILGMAVVNYGYRPHVRGVGPKQIAADLQELGEDFIIKDDAIRDWLNDAASELQVSPDYRPLPRPHTKPKSE